MAATGLAGGRIAADRQGAADQAPGAAHAAVRGGRRADGPGHLARRTGRSRRRVRPARRDRHDTAAHGAAGALQVALRTGSGQQGRPGYPGERLRGGPGHDAGQGGGRAVRVHRAAEHPRAAPVLAHQRTAGGQSRLRDRRDRVPGRHRLLPGGHLLDHVTAVIGDPGHDGHRRRGRRPVRRRHVLGDAAWPQQIRHEPVVRGSAIDPLMVPRGSCCSAARWPPPSWPGGATPDRPVRVRPSGPRQARASRRGSWRACPAR